MAQIIISGLAMGCIYALVALGSIIIFKSTNLLNFAQGELVMFAAYLGVTTSTRLELPLSIAMAVTVVLCGLMGMLFELICYRPLRGKPGSTVIIATIGVSIALQNLATIVWGPYPLSMPLFGGSDPITLLGVALLPQNIVIMVFTFTLLALLFSMYSKSSIGRMMQATAQDTEAARLMGIKVNRIILVTFVLSGVLAGSAGFLLGPLFLVNCTVGFSAMLKGWSASIIGGFGNLEGAVLGALFLGVVEALTAGYVSTAYKDAIAFAILILVLLVAPQGFFGEKIGEKV